MTAFHALNGMGESPKDGFLAALESREPVVRINTACLMLQTQGFTKLDINPAVRILRDALSDSDHALRVQAAHALASQQRDTDTVLPVLIEGLKHKTPGIRQQAIYGLQMFRGKQAETVVPALAALLKDSDKDVKHAVLQVIWQYGPTSVPHIMAALEDKED